MLYAYMLVDLIEVVEWCALRDLNVEQKIIPQAIISNGSDQHDGFLLPYSCRHFTTGTYQVQPYHVTHVHIIMHVVHFAGVPGMLLDEGWPLRKTDA